MLASAGNYRLIRPLGAGGMGEVYLAEDTRLERSVALKILSVEFAADPARRQRFYTEAKAVAALNHPNICIVHDVGETPDGRPFIAMELLEGETLNRWLQQGRVEIKTIIEIATQIGGGSRPRIRKALSIVI
jgi:serine/threonine-protein kinase